MLAERYTLALLGYLTIFRSIRTIQLSHTLLQNLTNSSEGQALSATYSEEGPICEVSGDYC